VETTTPTPPPLVPTPILGETVSVSIPGLPPGASLLLIRSIKKGSFVMGSPVEEKDGVENERPQHQVSLSQDFYIAKYETTNAQFAAFLNSKGSKSSENIEYLNANNASLQIHHNGVSWSADAGYENYPAACVSWFGARDFCAWLSELDANLAFLLPTEAEWEYACRAGTTARYFWGEDELELDIQDFAWYGGNANGAVHPIGLKYANSWGLFDMNGNAWEWCQDLFGAYSSEPQTDPAGADSGVIRVQRGGDYTSDPGRVRSAKRRWDLPETFCGFRVAALKQ
jgi:formylglycine-generating enzyme